ncbi:MAG: hypothetical protein LBJ37_07715 [Paucimonas sp.]|jgi:uncharacterized delta-60 repeat protein|nr:hypothetical protein [Paucimonas sp.]
MNVQIKPVTAKLDPAFGSGGKVRFELPNDDYVAQVTLGPAKEIIAVGVAALKPHALTLVRFDANGALDLSFGTKGVAVCELFAGFEISMAHCVTLPDSRVVALAARRRPNVRDAKEELFLACFLADGRLDSAFGSGGTLLLPAVGESRFARSLTVQKDGKVIAVGEGVELPSKKPVASVFRVTGKGQLDSSFAKAGVLGFDCALRAAVVQPDARLLFAGDLDPQAFITRVYADGKADLSLAGTSQFSLPLGGLQVMNIERLALEDNEWVYAIGAGSEADFRDQGFLTRLSLGGGMDSKFNGGKPLNLGETTPRDLLIDALGRVLTLELDSTTQQLIVRRVLSNGTVDSAFGIVAAGMEGGLVEELQPRLLAQASNKVLAAATLRDAGKQRAGLTMVRLPV